MLRTKKKNMDCANSKLGKKMRHLKFALSHRGVISGGMMWVINSYCRFSKKRLFFLYELMLGDSYSDAQILLNKKL